MYLEISPRRSGKTTRLINAAVRYCRENYQLTCCIISPNLTMSYDIEKRLKPYGISNWQTSTCIEPGYDMFFFDEFDFIRSLKAENIDAYYLNYYYVTTPSKMRIRVNRELPKDDFLLELLRYNLYQYHKFPTSAELVRSHTRILHPGTIMMECFGEFAYEPVVELSELISRL